MRRMMSKSSLRKIFDQVSDSILRGSAQHRHHLCLHAQVDFDKSGKVDLTECYAMVLNVYLKIALWVTLCEYVLETDACVQ